MSKLTERVLARMKTASWDGPFLWSEDDMLTVWASLDSYGRVHHVTKDLIEAEKALQRVQSKFLASFREHGINYKVSDIHVDGRKGSGRNPMSVYFTLSWRGTSPQEAEKAISDGYWGIKDLRKMAKAKTFPEAKSELWDYLKSKRWKTSDPNLKVSHATSPDGDVRVWFKSQAVYYTVALGGSGHSFKNARSTHMDIRRITPEKFVKQIEKWAAED